MSNHSSISIVLSCVLSGFAGGQSLSLVEDINKTPNTNPSSNPSGFVTLAARTLFAAVDANGYSVFVTGGTAATTSVVMAAPAGYRLWAYQMRAVGAAVVFFATNGSGVHELWRTDGTSAGTVRISAVPAFSQSSTIPYLAVAGGTLFFAAGDMTTGKELWATDGTASGTRLVKDIVAGATGSEVQWLATFGTKVVFSADDGVSGRELWISDGTGGGTVQVRDIAAGPASSTPVEMVEHRGAVYFRAYLAATGGELWRSDGTAAGTAMVKDINPGSGSSFVTGAQPIGTDLCFIATSSVGRRVYRSNGTAAGTVALTSPAADPIDLAVCAGRIYFRGNDPSARGIELWEVIAQAPGYKLVRDINPSGSSYPRDFVAVGTQLFFSAFDATHGRELWRVDTTTNACDLLLDANPGTRNSDPRELYRAPGNRLFYVCDGRKLGREPWVSDGSTAGTKPIADLRPSRGTWSSKPEFLTPGLGLTFFRANSMELWRTDGTSAGTIKLRSFTSSSSAIYEGNALAIGDKFYSAAAGTQLIVSDGTVAGTSLVAKIPGTRIEKFRNLHGRLLFGVHDYSNSGVWISDGTAAGTYPLRRGFRSNGNATFADIVVAGKYGFFEAGTSSASRELWRTDGTVAGTIKLQGNLSGFPTQTTDNLVALGDRLLFTAYDSQHGRELWASDGTIAGTGMLFDIWSGRSSSHAGPMAEIDGLVYLTASIASVGQVWQTDGTVSGTKKAFDISVSGWINDYHPVEGGVYFRKYTAGTGREPWFSDGTLAGTRALGDLTPGPTDTGIWAWIPAGGREILLQAYVAGKAGIWRSDGTPVGTRPLLDESTRLQLAGSTVLSRGRLLVSGKDMSGDHELWMVSGLGSAEQIGVGSTQRTYPPRLSASRPVLGSSGSIRIRDAAPNLAGLLVLGAPRYAPSMLSATAALYVEFGLPTLNLGVTVGADGKGRLGVVVPSTPSLIGVEIMAQVGLGPTSNVPLATDLTNALLLVPGV